MVNQGFFSASRLNEEKNKAKRFAGQKENTIAQVDGPSTPIGSEYGLGSLNINRGATFPVNIRPKKGFTLDDVYGIKKVEADFVSPRGYEVGQIASSDLTNLRVGSPEVRLASVKSYIPDVTKPYAPDDVGDYIRDTETKFPSKTYTDSRGYIYTKKPYTETTPGFQVYGGTGAQLIRRKGDDPNFSQNYSEASDRENFIKDRNAYVKDQGRPTPPDPNKLKTIEGPMDAFKSLFGFGRNYQSGQAEDYKRFLSENENYNYKMYRKDMRDKVFSESNYGKDVERGTIDKPGYYYKDFQQPGVYRSEKEVDSYIKDRGAFLTGMPSNFQGGVSGVGKKTDDFSKDPRYQSTAGTFAKENEKKEPSTLQKVGNFLGDVTNKALGIQTAEASQIGGPLPRGTETPTTGDTSFSAYVRGGGAGQERGTTTPTAAPKQTVASLPSNYKATEAEAFRKAAAFKEAQKIAKRNPNVSVGVDSKGQPKATAAKDTGKAKAQAAAVNRKISGKSISSVKKANTAKMKAAAAARHAAFKKTGKSTASARKAAAKASVKAAAKKRHAAFKKRRAARRKSKKGKK